MGVLNVEGVSAYSPGLAAEGGLPWLEVRDVPDPNGVAVGFSRRNAVRSEFRGLVVWTSVASITGTGTPV